MNIIQFRRELHKYAEPSWHEVRTSARLAEELAKLGYEPKLGLQAVDTEVMSEITRIPQEAREADMARAVAQGADPAWVARTGGVPGVVAELNTGRPGPVIALRFDIDALPYRESAAADYPPVREGYASVNDAVHACGHDGHTAIGMGLAAQLMECHDELCGKIRLLFQPSEEAPFGADSMVARGLLDDVDYFIAQHIAISGENKPLPSGSFACGCDDFMSYTRLDVHFIGRAAHPCGASQEGRNAILAACAATLGIHSIAPHEDGLFRVNVGMISGGVVINTIAPNATISLEYRGQTDSIDEYARRRVMEVLEGAAKMYGCTLQIDDLGWTCTAKSDRGLMNVLREAAEETPWFTGRIFELANVGGSDDATVMMRRVQAHGGQATYFGLGADTTDALHNEAFDFDEGCMAASVEVCMRAVRKLCR